MRPTSEVPERDVLRYEEFSGSEEFDAEVVELLPARTEMALLHVHVNGVANGNKGTIIGSVL